MRFSVAPSDDVRGDCLKISLMHFVSVRCDFSGMCSHVLAKASFPHCVFLFVLSLCGYVVLGCLDSSFFCL